MPKDGNGARETLRNILQERLDLSADKAFAFSDLLLIDLFIRGFKIVPLEPEDLV